MADPQSSSPPSAKSPPPSSGGDAEAARPPDGEELSPLKVRIVELAQEENARAAQHRRRREDFAKRGELLLVDVPRLFFQLAAGLRESVNRFNGNLVEDDVHAPLRYEETPAVTLRDPGMDDVRVSVWRRGGRFELGLRMMDRAGKPPMPLIEGYGTYGMELNHRVMMRIEGWVENGQTIYWYRIDFKRLQMAMDEVPDRIVMSILQRDPASLYRTLKTRETAETSSSG